MTPKERIQTFILGLALLAVYVLLAVCFGVMVVVSWVVRPMVNLVVREPREEHLIEELEL